MTAETNTAIQTALRKRASELLAAGEVAMVIGWEASRFADKTTPAFITTPQDAERLVFNEYCVNTLGKYALREKAAGRVAVCARGCDSRAINRMNADNQIDRSDVVLLGIPCPGMTDRATGKELMKCQNCTHRNHVTSDELLAEQVEERQPDRFKVVQSS